MNNKLLEERARILQAIRRFFILNGYLEVETPLRIPVPVPEANIDLFDSEGWFLQSSPELCMKRLVAKGYDKIFQICKCFRKDERSDRHLTELTMLEWYTAGSNYLDLMKQCEALIRYIVAELGSSESKFKPERIVPDSYCGQPSDQDSSQMDLSNGFNNTELLNRPCSIINYNDKTIDIAGAWRRITVEQAFSIYGSMSMEEALLNNRFDSIMGFDIEPNLGMDVPVFLFDYPSSLASLSRLKPDNEKFAERFELYIAGIELANGFSELTDPVEQRKRFEKEIEIRKKAGKGSSSIPEKFINDLSLMPDTAGIALGIDRLVMLLTNSASIDQVVAFTPEEL